MSIDEPHKRFIVFYYESYYPSGGFGDATAHFDALDDAVESCKQTMADEVYDRMEGRMVFSRYQFELERRNSPSQPSTNQGAPQNG